MIATFSQWETSCEVVIYAHLMKCLVFVKM
jgi:hypothetical protein